MEHTYFKPDKLEFQDAEGNMISAPGFVNRSAKNYRFDHLRNRLQKKCYGCQVYFDVQEFKNNRFLDVHNEEEMRFHSDESGYATRCRKCEIEFEKLKASKEVVPIVEETEHSSEIPALSAENERYLRILAAMKNMPQNEFLNALIDLIRKHNQLEITYTENIK